MTRLTAVACLFLAAAACSDDGLEAVGRAAAVRLGAVSTDGSGVTVVVPECFGYDDHVDTLIVYRDEGTVWRIEATEAGGAALRDVVVGATPPGFREVVPFDRAALDGLVHVSVSGSLDGGRGAPVAMTSFRVDDLPDDPIEGGCGD